MITFYIRGHGDFNNKEIIMKQIDKLIDLDFKNAIIIPDQDWINDTNFVTKYFNYIKH